MYLLDYKIPKRLEEPRDKIYKHYIQTTEEGREYKKNQRKLMTEAVGCFVYNASYALSGGCSEFDITLRPSSFSQPLLYNCNRVKRKVSYRYTKTLIEWMGEHNLIELSVGSVTGWEHRPSGLIPSTYQSSVVQLSEELIELLQPVSSKYQQEVLNVLEFRGVDGKPLAKRLREPQKRLITLLDTYNQYMKECEITLDGESYMIAGKKVFNEGWDLGGRTYLSGPKIMQGLLRRETRGSILINGNKTVEIDYSALHPRMIAEMEGAELGDDFDPYQIVLDGYDPECIRKIAKLGMLILINCGSLRSGCMALSAECNANLPLNDWKASGLIPDPLGVKEVMKALMERNQYARGWFLEKKGLTLQNLDSRILDIVIEYWLERGVITIPIHDSVIIEEKYLAECVDIMYDAYSRVLGSKHNCKLKVEEYGERANSNGENNG